MINNAMFSSNRDDWETPLDLFNRLDAIYHFDLDVCALPHNAKCDKYYAPDDDGLSKQWGGTCWMSPPYGRQIGKWMEKRINLVLPGQRWCVWSRPEQIQRGGTTMLCGHQKSHTYAAVSNLLAQDTGRHSRVQLLFLANTTTPRSS